MTKKVIGRTNVMDEKSDMYNNTTDKYKEKKVNKR